jgi:hypothetical protein
LLRGLKHLFEGSICWRARPSLIAAGFCEALIPALAFYTAALRNSHDEANTADDPSVVAHSTSISSAPVYTSTTSVSSFASATASATASTKDTEISSSTKVMKAQEPTADSALEACDIELLKKTTTQVRFWK